MNMESRISMLHKEFAREAAAAQVSHQRAIRLVAVSKKHAVEKIEEAYIHGHRDFGENYLQEMIEKAEMLSRRCPEIRWHFIGQMQSRKIPLLAKYSSLVHGVQRVKVAERLAELKQPFLVQLRHPTDVRSKALSTSEWARTFRESEGIHKYCRGTMFVANPGTRDEGETIESQFAWAASESKKLEEQGMSLPRVPIRSWGMSADYRTAIRHGANMLRLGTRVFGDRPTSTLGASSTLL